MEEKKIRLDRDIKAILIATDIIFSFIIFLWINIWIGLFGLCIAYGLKRLIITKTRKENVIEAKPAEPKPKPTINELLDKYINKRGRSEYRLKTWINHPGEVSRLTCRLGLLDCIIDDLKVLLDTIDNTITKTTMELIKEADEKMASRKTTVSTVANI